MKGQYKINQDVFLKSESCKDTSVESQTESYEKSLLISSPFFHHSWLEISE